MQEAADRLNMDCTVILNAVTINDHAFTPLKELEAAFIRSVKFFS
jgi:hypothetical protein